MKMLTRSEKEQLAEIQAYISLCFVLMEEYDIKEKVNYTGLSLRTLYRLKAGGATIRMQVRTLQLLGYAAGIQLSFGEKGKAAVKVVPKRRRPVSK